MVYYFPRNHRIWLTMFYIGLPQWQHPAWSKIGLNNLADYSHYFNCVEGNTTFYALPSLQNTYRWRDMTPEHFRFCFKFPSIISHQYAMINCASPLRDFYHCLQPLHERLGQIWLQLPATFSPRSLPGLWQFLDALPRSFTYGVEVRHRAFFAKGDAEKALNQGLHQRQINRVILDSRPIHHALPHSAALREAQKKKPKVPVHALLTAKQPIIRFVGSDQITTNHQWFSPWINKLALWSTTSTPYLFIHTPDCHDAPQQARALWHVLQAKITSMPPIPDWPIQSSLF